MNLKKVLNEIASVAEADKNIISCYLSGSYANGYAIDGISDLDLLFLCNNYLDIDELKHKIQAKNNEFELDLNQLLVSSLNSDDNTLFREFALSSKLCGICIYGEDIIKTIQKPVLSVYISDTIRHTLHMMENARESKFDIELLDYPDKSDRFYGYLTMRNDEISTKQLISIYTWIGTSYLALQGIYCGCKKECIKNRKQLSDDDFSLQIESVYTDCRERWKYTLPSSDLELKKLENYCRELLRYEKVFVERIKEYIK